MAPSGDHGAAKAKDLQLLLTFSRGSQRIPDELAADIGGGKALVVGALGSKAKVWPVEVGQDGDGAFLGRGWPEFPDACGAGAGWLLILRHRGRGVLTVKAFDDSGCFRELGAPPAAEATSTGKDASRRPQFICVLSQDSLKKMLLPCKFVRQCIPNEGLNTLKAIVFGPLGKVSPIELEMNRSDLFFASGWSQFLAFHGITEANVLLLRYEANMVFTVKVFTVDGCQMESKHRDIIMQQCNEEQQQAISAATWKCKSKNNWPSIEEQKKPKGSMTSLPKSPLLKKSIYEIGPTSWIKKQINPNALAKELALATAFCDAIGLREHCTITLKTSMDSSESWQVLGFPSKIKNKSYRLGQGWKKFCQENNLELGDICTFSVVETTIWHVDVTRSKEKINQFRYVNPSTSSNKRISNINRSSRKGKKRPKGSRTYLNKALLKTKCVFEIGPPAWIKKEINTCAINNKLYLAPDFCEAIGIQEPCIITLKISTSSTKAWQTRVIPYKNSSHHVGGLGWKSFCQENGIKVGDVCTFNIVDTTEWHVTITCG